MLINYKFALKTCPLMRERIKMLSLFIFSTKVTMRGLIFVLMKIE